MFASTPNQTLMMLSISIPIWKKPFLALLVRWCTGEKLPCLYIHYDSNPNKYKTGQRKHISIISSE